MNKRKVNLIVDVVFLIIVLTIIIIGKFLEKRENEIKTQRYDFTILEKDNEISALYTDGTYVYVGTNTGIHIYNAESLNLVNEIDNISMVYTASIIGDGENGIWVGHESGLTYIDDKMNQISFEYPQIPKGRVNAVAIKDGTIYCGTYNGAARIEKNGSNWEVVDILTKEDGLICDSVNIILPLEDGILFGSYLDTDGGITIINDDGEIDCFGIERGIPHPYITSVVEKSNGNILIGTGYMRDGGLVELVKNDRKYQVLKTYSIDDGLPGEKIRYIFDDDITTWITTEYDGVLIKVKEPKEEWMDYKSIYLTMDSGLSDNEIKCIVCVNDSYWLGGKYGLTIVPKNIVK